jgi:hypothetical protein
MSYLHRATLACALLAAGLAAAPPCGDSPEAAEVQRRTAAAVDELRSYTVEQRDAFVRKVNLLLAELDQDLAALRARAEEAGAEAGAPLQESLAGLERRRGELAQRLDRAAGTAAEGWNAFRDGVLQAYQDLSRAVAAEQD